MFTQKGLRGSFIRVSIMSSNDQASSSTPQNSEEGARVMGKCKWFNKKSGFGFITALEGEHNGNDIFVHHTDIFVGTEQFRYLVQGEYVHFLVCENSDSESKHRYSSNNVRGILGGPLMCETREQNKFERDESEERPSRPPRKNGRGPRDDGDGEWKASKGRGNRNQHRN